MSAARDCLRDAFDDLDEGEFKLFKTKLSERKTEPRIRRGKIASADKLDTVEELARTFTEKVAVQVAIEIFQSMNRPGLAGELKEFYEKEYGASAGGGGAAGESNGGMCHVVEGRHFIDYHRTALIERVSNVEAILDRLLDKRVLTQEQYEDIASESTNFKKMRKLMNGAIKSGGTKAENELYMILEEIQHYLMEDLKQKQN